MLIVTLAEFGRTPAINASLGRDHFASAWSMTHDRLRRSRAARSTARPTRRATRSSTGRSDAAQLFATIYSALGINPHKNYYVGSRPIPLVNPGVEPIKAVLR